jgi:hypothetical protein
MLGNHQRLVVYSLNQPFGGKAGLILKMIVGQFG